MARKGPRPRPVIDRVAPRIALSDSGCIEWIGALSDQGYGYFRLGPEDGARRTYAHRWSYEHHKGPIPSGLHLDHLCRNRACVNPDHLEPVTPGENILRGDSSPAVNARKTSCLRGHELCGPNLYVNPTSGYRHCRECARIADRARSRSRRKAA